MLTCYCLDDPEKMRDSFQRLLDVQLEEEDDTRTQVGRAEERQLEVEDRFDSSNLLKWRET